MNEEEGNTGNDILCWGSLLNCCKSLFLSCLFLLSFSTPWLHLQWTQVHNEEICWLKVEIFERAGRGGVVAGAPLARDIYQPGTAHQPSLSSKTLCWYFFMKYASRLDICQQKHRKNCECCPGHYLIVNNYSLIMSWFKFRNFSVIVSTKLLSI